MKINIKKPMLITCLLVSKLLIVIGVLKIIAHKPLGISYMISGLVMGGCFIYMIPKVWRKN